MNGTCFAAHMSIIGTVPARTYARTHAWRECTRAGGGRFVLRASRARARANTPRSTRGGCADIGTRPDPFIPRPCVYERRAPDERRRDLFIPRVRACAWASEERRCESASEYVCARARVKQRLMEFRRGETSVRRDRIAKAARSSAISTMNGRALPPRLGRETRFPLPAGSVPGKAPAPVPDGDLT